ncbi:DNA ligase D [Scleromatobacter humisilvae]|uniref:DNA ligase (ATP) n=1 Tax=Scleromatobacter humisilvae TaxID=2897159 RepID=A0A9X2C248_9BURK|nr:DNA ligase D [Scleromatobacter humisilvae]MCK9689538.1 DNA ligase D [Scleromatobacter humisilvae]
MATAPRTSSSRAPARASRVTPAKRARQKPTSDDGTPLARYRAKRDFTITSEPGPVRTKPGKQLAFVIQKHDATRLHYDFRLELDGVLVSWAIPKGPSFDPKEKRLAVHVEDHPVAYGTFEGTIPKGQYGAGTVIVWDNGTWEPVGDPRAGLKAGKLVFKLHGQKLAGLWELVKIAKPGERQEPWLLFKKHDEWERPHADYDVVNALPDSVVAHPMKPLDDAPVAAIKRAGRTVAAVQKAAASPFDPSTLDGARKAALPETMSPQLATLARSAPTHGDWLYEIKFDGYRLMTRLAKGKATIITRGGHDWTHKMQPLADELATLGITGGWLDGEAVVLDADGLPHFNLLQNALDSKRSSEAIVYYVFDAPFINGYDLRAVPLHARRALLKQVIEAHAGDRVRFSDDFPADAAQVLETACSLHLEGVIAKRRDGFYTSSRSTDWLKLKCQARQEFVIGGFSDRSDNAKAVGALMLGYYDDHGVLQYAGRVGTGWSSSDAVDLRAKLAKLVSTKSPFPPGTTRSTRWLTRPAAEDHWVRPQLVAEVAFAEWTPDGSVRHASYQGLREDKDAKSVTREKAKAPPTSEKAVTAKKKTLVESMSHPAPAVKASSKSGNAEVEGVRITHPERVIDASTGHTKLDLARYYASIAEFMLPHLKSRPVSLVRAPEGVGGELFFQKHADVRTMPGMKDLPDLWEGHGALLEVPSAKALVAAAQMNVIEFHTWNSVKQKVDKPDRMIFDLDPGEGVSFATVREGTELMRALLAELGLQCWLKTSGGKGLHVVVPMSARLDYDTVKDFSQRIVQHMAATIPQRFVAKSGPSNRVGKIFVDYLRNGFNATTAAAFSARARPGLGVSMPIAWDELSEMKSGAHWTISDARDRLSFQKSDPWADYWRCKQTMTAAMKALQSAG